MKKSNVLLAGLAMLAGGLQAAPSNNLIVKNNTITVSPKQAKEKKIVKQEKEIEFSGTGGIETKLWDGGTPPKYYGQWLQSNGRQKWNK